MTSFKTVNDEIMSVSTHIEYSWGNEMELLPVSSGDETKAIEVHNSQYSIELATQKFLDENSDYWMYIRESELAELLQLALRHTKESDHVSSNQELDEETSILLLSASFDDAFLVKSLRMLNQEKILIALNLLLAYLRQTIKVPSKITKRPSDLQVVNWIILIIHIHMEDVLFSKDKTLRKFLKQLKKALSAKVEEYENFVCVQNCYSVIEKRNILPKTCTGKYSVECLDI